MDDTPNTDALTAAVLHFLKTRGRTKFGDLWWAFSPRRNTDAGFFQVLRDRAAFRTWLGNRVSTGLLDATGRGDERVWWVRDADSVKARRLLSTFSATPCEPLPVVPPRRIGVMEGLYVTPPSASVLREGSQDARLIPSRGLGC